MYDVIIIGAGPAGLAAAAGLNKNSKALIIEQGMNSHDRIHKNPAHLSAGVGGAGLFSDGKFSYYPAGTAVYQLSQKNIIKKAHEWIEKKMTTHGIKSSKFDKFKFGNVNTYTDILEKKYPSFYATLTQRRNLMLDISNINKRTRLLTHNLVYEIDKIKSIYILKIKDKRFGSIETVKSKNIILATGRFGTMDLKNILMKNIKLPFKYLRTEFGVRVESPSNIGFLSRKTEPDVKFIWKSSFGEVRTFCTCRDGEIWNIPYHNNLSALSGRSDGPKSGFSNFGLLVRLDKDPKLSNKIFQKVINNDAIMRQEAIVQSLKEFIRNTPSKMDSCELSELDKMRPWFPKNKFKKGNIRELLGNDCSNLLTEAITKLIKMSPDLDSNDVKIIFPSIEGVGEYLDTDKDLKVIGENIWVAGDSNGTFRGIIPAFISGYYAGHQCTMDSNSRHEYTMDSNSR